MTMEPRSNRIATKTVFLDSNNGEHDTLPQAQAKQRTIDLSEMLANHFSFRASDLVSAPEIAEWMLDTFTLVPLDPSMLDDDILEENKNRVLWLLQAVDKAEQWRGNTMPEEWPEFDAEITAMREAVAYFGKLVGATA